MRFTRIDSVLETWRIVKDILNNESPVHPYFVGTWGPDNSDGLVGGNWIDL